MIVGDSAFERMLASATRSEKELTKKIQAAANCPAAAGPVECPVCQVAKSAMEHMLTVLQQCRNDVVTTAIQDPITAHDMAISTFTLSESYRSFIAICADMMSAAHDAYDVISAGKVEAFLALEGSNLREAAKQVSTTFYSIDREGEDKPN